MDPRTEVNIALARKGLNLTALAKQLGVPQQSLSRTLKGEIVNQRSHWPAMLAALDLQVIVVPKDRS